MATANNLLGTDACIVCLKPFAWKPGTRVDTCLVLHGMRALVRQPEPVRQACLPSTSCMAVTREATRRRAYSVSLLTSMASHLLARRSAKNEARKEKRFSLLRRLFCWFLFFAVSSSFFVLHRMHFVIVTGIIIINHFTPRTRTERIEPGIASSTTTILLGVCRVDAYAHLLITSKITSIIN